MQRISDIDEKAHILSNNYSNYFGRLYNGHNSVNQINIGNLLSQSASLTSQIGAVIKDEKEIVNNQKTAFLSCLLSQNSDKSLIAKKLNNNHFKKIVLSYLWVDKTKIIAISESVYTLRHGLDDLKREALVSPNKITQGNIKTSCKNIIQLHKLLSQLYPKPKKKRKISQSQRAQFQQSLEFQQTQLQKTLGFYEIQIQQRQDNDFVANKKVKIITKQLRIYA